DETFTIKSYFDQILDGYQKIKQSNDHVEIKKFEEGMWSGEYSGDVPIDDPIGIAGKPLNAVTYAVQSMIDNARKSFSCNSYSSGFENPNRIKSKDLVFEARAHDCQRIQSHETLGRYLKFLVKCWESMQGEDNKKPTSQYFDNILGNGRTRNKEIYYPVNHENFAKESKGILKGSSTLKNYSLKSTPSDKHESILHVRSIVTGYDWSTE
ncbi:hypothetical protein, partial [Brucella sp. 09RB8918]